MREPLPERLPPMLSRRAARPFDSEEHLFEVKWDGVRAIALVDGPGYRLHSRHRTDLRPRYPELGCLAALPPGTALDGELVVLQACGRPDFPAVLARENVRNPSRIARLARERPVVFMVFDLLYRDGAPLLQLPLAERRARMAEVVAALAAPQVVASEGIRGQGRELFAAVQQRGLEGIVAKRLDSPYRPGERTDHWQKIKQVQTVLCAILGYEPDGEAGFKSLIVATDTGGELRCVGRVGGGFSMAQKAEVWRLLQARRRAAPWLPAGQNGGSTGRWVEPGLYCSVSYLERTASGSLRAPVFLQMVEG